MFYLTVSSGITLTEEIPEMFTEYRDKFAAQNNNMVYLTENNKPVYPITHDEKNLYVLNGAEDDFKKYYIDEDNNELIIEKDEISYPARGKSHYQLMKISMKKLNSIIDNETLKIRIIYLYQDNQFTLLEYNLEDKSTQEISSNYIAP